MVQLASSDNFLNNIVMYFAAVLLGAGSLTSILYSYSQRVSSIYGISSAQGRYKALPTCASLQVVLGWAPEITGLVPQDSSGGSILEPEGLDSPVRAPSPELGEGLRGRGLNAVLCYEQFLTPFCGASPALLSKKTLKVAS